MSTPAIHTFDTRQQHVVTPGEIRPGDWLRDLGTLRQVDFVDAISVAQGPELLFILHFVPQQGVPTLALGMSSRASSLVVLREPAP